MITLGAGLGDRQAEEPPLSFAGLLRQLRTAARLTQDELAEAASLSPRSISDLERGINRTAHKDTALLMADALGMEGPVRTAFVAAARGRAPVSEVLAAMGSLAPATPSADTVMSPQANAALASVGIKLARLVEAATAAAGDSSGGLVGICLIMPMAGIRSETTPTGRSELLDRPRSVIHCRYRQERWRRSAPSHGNSLRSQ
jgi:transcriptional regulator with XRE-family HTH domain